MTINPTSSITDMAAHLGAKPTIGPKAEVKARALADYKGKTTTLRDAAKCMNFGHTKYDGQPVTDGLTSAAIFDRYTRMQREEVMVDAEGLTIPRLTPKQLEVARVMWTDRVGLKIKASAEVDASRVPSVKCQGLWADPDENL